MAVNLHVYDFKIFDPRAPGGQVSNTAIAYRLRLYYVLRL